VSKLTAVPIWENLGILDNRISINYKITGVMLMDSRPFCNAYFAFKFAAHAWLQNSIAPEF
jgi:hypothetical protein